ncbi:protein of unknown function DUF374 [Desulfovibrio sp. X2]|uniref:lysophospholipid acyltransferase family protein n=1 Tax=Desulfovibrio sp. X2 TaxID=941449 RepID=UPI000358A2BE|nr:lysophospholipid acyltransferase family protein [Desulfovibrio sp. X2]EPR42284.1 protein of unknown function DUF374 [Desulfovibrio sp. X2]
MALRLDPVKIGRILTAVYKLWCWTLRYTVEGYDGVRAQLDQGRRVVFVLWHDELFAVPYYGYGKKLHLTTVVSQSKDGEFLAQILNGLSICTARGSSRRGGLQALREARRFMREEGRDIVVTVDGPKGPRHKAKEGAIYLAAKENALLLPIRAHYARPHVFAKAWDRFQLPLPFSRVRLVFGPAFSLGPEPLKPQNMPAELARVEQSIESLG